MRPLLFSLVVCLAACGATRTVGEACEDVGASFCDRFIECHVFSYADRSACIYGMISACCDHEACQEDVGKPANVDRCMGEISSVSCSAMSAYADSPSTIPAPLPAICRGVATP